MEIAKDGLGMKIVIIGATRGIGKALLETALNDKNDVTVLARTPDKITKSHHRLHVVKEDDLDEASVHQMYPWQKERTLSILALLCQEPSSR